VAFALGLLRAPFVGLLFGLRFRHSRPRLNSPDQLILLAADSFPAIIREFPQRSPAEPVNRFHLPSIWSQFMFSTRRALPVARLPPFELERSMGARLSRAAPFYFLLS